MGYILTGSGVRVKLLEAYAAGIPVVSTTIGAEGLSKFDGDTCALADDPEEFAAKTVELLGDPGQAAELARKARVHVMAEWDMAAITRKLAESYRDVIAEKRRGWGRWQSLRRLRHWRQLFRIQVRGNFGFLISAKSRCLMQEAIGL